MNTIFRETYANDSNITLIALPSMCYNVSFLWPCWTFFAPCWFILPNSNNIQSYFWCQEWKHFSTYMSYDFWKVYTERNCYFAISASIDMFHFIVTTTCILKRFHGTRNYKSTRIPSEYKFVSCPAMLNRFCVCQY